MSESILREDLHIIAEPKPDAVHPAALRTRVVQAPHFAELHESVRPVQYLRHFQLCAPGEKHPPVQYIVPERIRLSKKKERKPAGVQKRKSRNFFGLLYLSFIVVFV